MAALERIDLLDLITRAAAVIRESDGADEHAGILEELEIAAIELGAIRRVTFRGQPPTDDEIEGMKDARAYIAAEERSGLAARNSFGTINGCETHNRVACERCHGATS